eukprot:7727972-Alexandrium_andersonii.AAC.1
MGGVGSGAQVMRGCELEEDAETCSLDPWPPDDFRRAPGYKLELQSYSERLLFVKRRPGLEKHRALALAASSDAP